MPQVFRVGDLAQQMGVTVEELIFKLRSIGVDVANADSVLDLATVRAIITGKTLQKRRGEVIVRKEAAAAEEAKKPQAKPPLDRTKHRRPGRRPVSLDEELPDAVPNLAAMALPASPRVAKAAAETAARPVESPRPSRARHPLYDTAHGISCVALPLHRRCGSRCGCAGG